VRIAIFGIALEENYFSFYKTLLQCLDNEKVSIVLYKPFYDSLSQQFTVEGPEVSLFESNLEIEDVDYLFSIGGDGTLLKAAAFIRDPKIPILGINTGRLGFLSNVSTAQIEESIVSILKGEFDLDKRTLLEIDTDNNPFGDENFALNEITLQKKDTTSMVIIHAYLDGEFLNSYWADGLIISTPTGSTAYSLSCNGPIVLPGSGNIIITPIAPHNLNVRPLVIPDDKEITLKIEGRTDYFLIALDSKSVTVPSSIEINIRKSNKHINLIRLKEHSFLKTLREKLMWGLDKRN